MVCSMSGADRNEDEDVEKNPPSERPKERRIMVVCGKCRNHDIDDNSLLEIDFRHAVMSYVCRNCSFENRVSLNPPSSNYTAIGIGTGKR